MKYYTITNLCACYDLIVLLETCHEQNQQYPTLESFLELQKGNYHVVLRYFVKHVVGAHKWNNCIVSQVFPADKLCTTSDEVFALLVVKNNYDHWVDIFDKNDHQIPEPKRYANDRKKRAYSKIEPKFTAGGNVFESDKGKKQRVGHNKGFIITTNYTT